MYIEVTLDEFHDSQDAIREYISSNPENQFPHNARVTVKSDGELVYNDIIKAWARIENNYSYAEICWNDEENELYFSKYDNRYQIFKCYGETLVIEATDRNKCKIVISIN